MIFVQRGYTLLWLLFFRKCGVKQCGLGKVSTSHKNFFSYFYISKKFWKPCQTFGRLVLAVWSRADWLVFFKVSRTFLKYENGSKIFYELLRSILTYTELPHIFEKKVITLMYAFRMLKKIYYLLYYVFSFITIKLNMIFFCILSSDKLKIYDTYKKGGMFGAIISSYEILKYLKN